MNKYILKRLTFIWNEYKKFKKLGYKGNIKYYGYNIFRDHITIYKSILVYNTMSFIFIFNKSYDAFVYLAYLYTYDSDGKKFDTKNKLLQYVNNYFKNMKSLKDYDKNKKQLYKEVKQIYIEYIKINAK